MTSESLVTIAIPFYNAEAYLPYAIQSVINQTYKNWELLLIDDGSNDKSLEIAKKFCSIDHRITLINDNKNLGLAFRLNQSIKIAKGIYYARMDADDIMFKERISKQINILEANQDIDVLGSNACVINEHNEITGIRYNFENSTNDDSIKDCVSFIHPSITGKTSWFKNNLYDEKAIRIEDLELWSRTKSTSVFKYSNTPLIFYREVEGSYYIKYWKSIKSFFYISKKRFKEKKYLESCTWIIKGFSCIIKSIIYSLFAFLNNEMFLIHRRNNILDKENYGLLDKELKKTILVQ